MDMPQDQSTPTAIPPGRTPTPTLMLESSFIVQADMPVYLPNFAHPSTGCDWMGVAGQVFDSNGHEIHEMTIMLGNALSTEEQLSAARTGLAPAYGPGGYEIQISENPFDSSDFIWVQVYNPAGSAVSKIFYFDTFNDCTRNLILINFIPEINPNQPAPND